MKAIDLFCGAGGLTQGLRESGWDVIAGLDLDSSVAETYEINNPGSRFIHADLRNVTDDDIRVLAKHIPSHELLLAGCAPCQPFSKQRNGHGLRSRKDATLLNEFARFIIVLRPGVVLMENVPGIASISGFSSFRRFLKTLQDYGYTCAHGVLNACDFGVPQHRRRYTLLATRGSLVRLPLPDTSKPYKVTVRDAIAHYPPLCAGEVHAHIPNHCAAGLSLRNLERMRATPINGGSRRNWPEYMQLNCHRSIKSGFADTYGRMWWDRVAPTLTGRCNSFSNGRFGHPEQDRAISLREAATLQTFPENYEFYASRKKIAQWIGNAVPVLFAKALGEEAIRISP